MAGMEGTTVELDLGSDQEFSERVVALLWRHRRSQRWLSRKLGIHEGTMAQKMRGIGGNRWRGLEERLKVAVILGTTLDSRGLPRLDSNQQPADYRHRHVA